MSAPFDAVALVRKKRDGEHLGPAEIDWLLDAYTRGAVPDYQMAAFLMAVYFKGLDPDELGRLTDDMVQSGRRLDLSSLDRPTVDKHSTGGVGDKVSLVLGPLLASVGACVPQLSGRGLGHTGGTLDKLESIRGLRTDLAADEMLDVLGRVGCVICAAGPDLAPADRKLYALRDVTGTVESIPLIASSIMSKKIAEGTGALVLDVKVGSGAFMPDVASARRLGETMVAIGSRHGVATTAVLTRMDQPLGRAVGNAPEVEECVATMRGAGPGDLVELTVALALEMARLAGLELAVGPGAEDELHAALVDGRALACFEAMVRAQTGDPDAPLPAAAHVRTVPAPRSGYLQALDARGVGMAAWRLGAGRARKEDAVSPSAGLVCLAKPGEEIEEGQPIVELHTDDGATLGPATALVEGAVTIGPEPPEPASLVMEVIRP